MVDIQKVERKRGRLSLYTTTNQSFQTCPCCHHETKKIYDYSTQIIKDVSYQHKMVFLVLKNQTYQMYFVLMNLKEMWKLESINVFL